MKVINGELWGYRAVKENGKDKIVNVNYGKVDFTEIMPNSVVERTLYSNWHIKQ